MSETAPVTAPEASEPVSLDQTTSEPVASTESTGVAKPARLSKAEKKALAAEKRKEHWKSKRADEKANKKRKRAEMIEKIKEAGGDPRAELPRGKDNPTYQLKRRKVTEMDFSNQKVVIDLAFDAQMNEKDIRSLVSQLTYLYGRNRVMQHPLQLYLTEFGGQLEKGLTAHNGFEHWKGVNCEKRPYIDVFPKEKLVYLSAESETTLETLNEDDIYIIGGLVDHNRLKGICHQKATDQGIRTARLPIDNFMALKTRKVLTVNQVYEILAAYAEEKDWAKAFDSIIPKRKGGSLLTAESSSKLEGESENGADENTMETDEKIQDAEKSVPALSAADVTSSSSSAPDASSSSAPL